MAFASAQLHIGGNFRNAIGSLKSLSVTDLDLLLGDFDAAANVTLGAVFVKGIIVQSFVVSRSVVFLGFCVTRSF